MVMVAVESPGDDERGRVGGRRGVTGPGRAIVERDDVASRSTTSRPGRSRWSSARPSRRRSRRLPRRGRRRRACWRRSVADQSDATRTSREAFVGRATRSGEGMQSSSGHPPRDAVRTRRGSGVTTTVIFDFDGVLVDSRAVFLSCVNYAFDEARPARRGRRGAAALHRPAVRVRRSVSCSASRTTRRSWPPASTALSRALRDRLADRDDRRARHREALEALDGHRLAVATSKPHAFADPLLEAMGLAPALRGRGRSRPQRARRGQDRDARPRA